ncbi:MAG TPA: hypothetical protein VHB21_22180, partial [Minicystis sp.]|nr:hypothetical protein [Minicystis sp.]
VAALGAHHVATRSRDERVRALAHAAVFVQLVSLTYDPRRLVPTAADKAAGDRLVALLRSLPGETFFPAHGALLPLAGKKPLAQEMAMNDSLGIGGGKPGAALKREIAKAIREHRFQSAVLDTDFWRRQIEAEYKRERDVFSSRDVFYPVTGMRTRPRYVYVAP